MPLLPKELRVCREAFDKIKQKDEEYDYSFYDLSGVTEMDLMDLSKIDLKFKKNTYSTIEEFTADLRQVYQHFLQYSNFKDKAEECLQMLDTVVIPFLQRASNNIRQKEQAQPAPRVDDAVDNQKPRAKSRRTPLENHDTSDEDEHPAKRKKTVPRAPVANQTVVPALAKLSAYQQAKLQNLVKQTEIFQSIYQILQEHLPQSKTAH